MLLKKNAVPASIYSFIRFHSFHWRTVWDRYWGILRAAFTWVDTVEHCVLSLLPLVCRYLCSRCFGLHTPRFLYFSYPEDGYVMNTEVD